MVICCIKDCTNESGKSRVSFFRIPTVRLDECEITSELSRKRRALWLARINRKDLKENDVKDYTRVCSRHFVSGKPAYHMCDTDPDWAPCLFLGYKFQSSEIIEDSVERNNRRARRCTVVDLTLKPRENSTRGPIMIKFCNRGVLGSLNPFMIRLRPYNEFLRHWLGYFTKFLHLLLI